MPKAVPVTYADFLRIEATLKSLGFDEIHRGEVAIITLAHGLIPPRRIVIAGEVGFKCSLNGYTVKVWTSCVREAVERCREAPLFSRGEAVGRPPGEDLGWIVVTDAFNHAQYFARPSLRTKNFVRTLCRRVWITLWKVQHRPLCEKCRKFMHIFRKEDGGTFWACLRNAFHETTKPVWLGWDFGLPPGALAFALAWRSEFHRYLKRERARGNNPQRARTIRHGWIETKDPY